MRLYVVIAVLCMVNSIALAADSLGSLLTQLTSGTSTSNEAVVNRVRCPATIWVSTSFSVSFYADPDQAHSLGIYSPLRAQRKFVHNDICLANQAIYAVTGNNLGAKLSHQVFRTKLTYDNRMGPMIDEATGQTTDTETGTPVSVQFPEDFDIDPDVLTALNNQPLNICNLQLEVNGPAGDQQNINTAQAINFYAAQQLLGIYMPTVAQHLFTHNDICVNNQPLYGVTNGATYKTKSTYSNIPITNSDGSTTSPQVFVQFPDDFQKV